MVSGRIDCPDGLISRAVISGACRARRRAPNDELLAPAELARRDRHRIGIGLERAHILRGPRAAPPASRSPPAPAGRRRGDRAHRCRSPTPPHPRSTSPGGSALAEPRRRHGQEQSSPSEDDGARGPHRPLEQRRPIGARGLGTTRDGVWTRRSPGTAPPAPTRRSRACSRPSPSPCRTTAGSAGSCAARAQHDRRPGLVRAPAGSRAGFHRASAPRIPSAPAVHALWSSRHVDGVKHPVGISRGAAVSRGNADASATIRHNPRLEGPRLTRSRKAQTVRRRCRRRPLSRFGPSSGAAALAAASTGIENVDRDVRAVRRPHHRR